MNNKTAWETYKEKAKADSEVKTSMDMPAEWVPGAFIPELPPIKIKDPMFVSGVLSPEDLKFLRDYALALYAKEKENNNPPDPSFGRYQYANTTELNNISEKLLSMAKQYFEDEELMTSWNFLAIYEGPQAKLWKHKDDNACQYNIDLSIYQREPWDIYVEGVPYTMQENDAVLMYGNDQLHWREAFPNPETNLVINCFFFYCTKGHWAFTKGLDYLEVIRGNISEKDWEEKKEKK